MPLAQAWSVALVGLEGHLVEIEADIAQGLPKTTLIGLPDASLSEARDRVRAAVVNSGDNLTFRGTFNNSANYQAFLDVNGDGTINSGDNLQFRNRFNKALNWTV